MRLICRMPAAPPQIRHWGTAAPSDLSSLSFWLRYTDTGAFIGEMKAKAAV